MRRRPSSRLIILSPDNRVLLFLFAHTSDVLRGKSYWATPGGGLEPGESFEQAALRELREETGLIRKSPGAHITSRSFSMTLPSGEVVLAEERFFIIHSEGASIDTSGWSGNEKHVIRSHYWWTIEELRRSHETIFPCELLINILADL